MTAVHIDPQQNLVRLYDQPEPRLKMTPRTLGAFAAVAVLYAGGGMMLNLAGIDIRIPMIRDTPPSVVEIWRPLPPETTPVDKPIIATPPVVRPTDIAALPTDTPTLPVDPGPATIVEEPTIMTSTATTVGPGPVATPVTPTAPPSPPMIRNPDWLQKPTAAQMNRLFPVRAAERGLRGAVTMECRVTAQGAMNACTVVSETPKGYGFGDAALSSTRFFKMSPRTIDGQAVEGAKVRIPMGFIAD